MKAIRVLLAIGALSLGSACFAAGQEAGIPKAPPLEAGYLPGVTFDKKLDLNLEQIDFYWELFELNRRQFEGSPRDLDNWARLKGLITAQVIAEQVRDIARHVIVWQLGKNAADSYPAQYKKFNTAYDKSQAIIDALAPKLANVREQIMAAERPAAQGKE